MVLAIFHFIINTYFWQVLVAQDWVDLGYKIFLSFMFAYLTYHYAALFSKKFRERSDELTLKQNIGELKSELDQSRSVLDELRTKLVQLKSDNDKMLIQNEHQTEQFIALQNEFKMTKDKLSRSRKLKKNEF